MLVTLQIAYLTTIGRHPQQTAPLRANALSAGARLTLRP
jgi:hypothetical protein